MRLLILIAEISHQHAKIFGPHNHGLANRASKRGVLTSNHLIVCENETTLFVAWGHKLQLHYLNWIIKIVGFLKDYILIGRVITMISWQLKIKGNILVLEAFHYQTVWLQLHAKFRVNNSASAVPHNKNTIIYNNIKIPTFESLIWHLILYIIHLLDDKFYNLLNYLTIIH